MRTKDKTLMAAIVKYIGDFSDMFGISPTIHEVAEGVGASKTNVHRYVSQMIEDGIIEYSGRRTMTVANTSLEAVRVPVLGRIACGIPKFADENIEEYIRLPVALFGRGDYYILRANGGSMVKAGIDDGDLVLIRKQNTADPGQIVVALIDDEATLKRYYPEPEKYRIRLHPENPSMKDIYVDDCIIQGVAVNVIKDLR